MPRRRLELLAALHNHAAGVSRVRVRSFLAGVALEGSPRVIVYTLLGAGLAAPSLGRIALVGAGTAALGTAGAATALAPRRRVPA